VIRRLRKIILYTVLAISLLVIILLALTQTRFFKDWIRDKIVDAANQSLNASLTIDRIEGNLFWHAEIIGIRLIYEPDTIAYVPRMVADYSPRGIFAGEINIDSIFIDSPFIAVRERSDSSWNFSDLVRSDSIAKVESDSPDGSFNYDIFLNNLRLESGAISVSGSNPSIPHRIENLFINLQGSFRGNRMELRLDDMHFKTFDPSLELSCLSLTAILDTSQLIISELDLETQQNHFKCEGALTLSEPWDGRISIRSDKLAADEFAAFTPLLDDIRAYPSLLLTADLSQDTLSALLDLSEKAQAINISASVAGFGDLISDSHDTPDYRINLRITGIDAARWSGNSEWDYILNGEIGIKGRDFDPEKSKGTWFADLGGFEVEGRYISEIHSQGSYNNGSLDGELDLKGEFGEINATVSIEDVLKRQRYRASVETHHLNAAPLAIQSELESDLNVQLQFEGQGLTLEEISGTLELDLAPSVMRGIEIDSMFSRIRLSEGNATLDTLVIATKIAEISVSGVISLDGEFDARFNSRLIDPEQLNRYLDIGELNADGRLGGTIKGSFDSLSCTVDYNLTDIEYDSDAIDSSRGHISVILKDNEIVEGEISAVVNSTTVGDFAIGSINLDGRLIGQSMDIDIRGTIDSNITAHVEATIIADSVIRIELPMIDAHYFGHHLIGGSPDMAVVIDEDSYLFQNFKITGVDESPRVELALEGLVSLTGEEDIRLSLSGLTLDNLNSIFGPKMDIGGVLSLDAGITGTAGSPEISGEFRVIDGHLSNHRFDEFNCRVKYQSDSLAWHAGLQLSEDHEVTTSGYAPVSISLPDSVTVMTEVPMRADLKADSIPFGLFSIPIGHLRNTQGMISCDLHLENTLQDPLINGALRLDGGGFDIPRHGVSLRDIGAQVTADGERINLNYLRAEREDGHIELSGYVDVTDSLIYGKFRSGELSLTAEELYLLQHKQYDIKISSDIGVNAINDSIRYLGTVDVLRSSLYLPAIVDIGGNLTDDDVTVPLLVTATSKTKAEIADSLGVSNQSPVDADKSAPSIIDRLSGRLLIEMPRNTWIKGPDMRFELSGRVEAVQDGPDFRLYGTVNVVRGQYNILGRRLTINHGTVTFTGQEELNPDIDVECQYEIREKDQDRKILQMYITGNLDSLSLSFAIDNSEIEQDDAVSYLLFGTSMDELSSGQQSGVQGIIAMDMASSLASAQLSRLAGDQLALDYIEIYAKDNWQSATFVVGKYITDDIFMSYERDFEERTGSEIAHEKITVEYEFMRNFSIRLVTGSTSDRGVDLLFRLERK
jgi:translocation and assembly module TamB